MKEFSDLIRYCSEKYNATPQCQDCAMGSCKKNCGSDCYNCLNHIHNYNNKTDHYSCLKITYNYILKHGHRYASEISKAVSDIKSSLDKNNPVCVLSVGCGPSTELYGSIHALDDMTVNYIGFDKNNIWNDIQEFNKNIFKQTRHNVMYSTDDFFDFMQQPMCVDILILNYFFSDLIKFNADITESFIEKLSILVNLGKFKNIIVNDIPLFYNNGTGYVCMENLDKKISLIEKEVQRRHFAQPNEYQIAYGCKLDDELSIPVKEPVVQKFSPFGTCGSIQLIIKVKKGLNYDIISFKKN